MPQLKAVFARLGGTGKNVKNRKFGTFGGVFVPDLLTILGVIMYLRLGWVVGNAGFLGTVLIIVLAKTVTLFTGLSMSSMTTNIKIGAGGAYSIISKSLGLEAGGSIGIPLYIAQTLSAALYLIGFSAVWTHVFPAHNFLLVASIAWLLLLTASYISAHFAIKIQYFIMVIIGVSIVSFLMSPAQSSGSVVLIGKFENAGFWKVFAIFFPAVTGIMAGANMSGDLKNPRNSIPKGTLNAIWVTMIIYIVMAYVVSRVATMAELRGDEMIMVKKAFWGPVVIAGIMGSTLSSALGSMLGAPRILQALAAQRTVPFHAFLKQKAANNEPRNAIILTGIIIEVALVLGNLDFLASLITMFFLITYGMLNWVVFIEQSMKIISFRPSFRVPRIVPLLGGLSCLFIMFLIDPIFSVVALVLIIFIYVSLARRGLKSRYGDIRGGMFVALAERASRMAAKFPDHALTWKPDLLVPIEDPRVWGGPLLFIRNVTYPAGSMFAFTVNTQDVEPIRESLATLLEPLENEGILVSSAVIEDDDFLRGAGHVIQTLEGGALRPNTLFLTLGDDPQKDSMLNTLIEQATRHGIGSIILRQHPRMAFGMQKDVNLWLRDKSPNWHLAMLISLQLQSNWEGRINLVTVAENADDVPRLNRFLERLTNTARLPSETEFYVLTGSLKTAIKKAPRADVNLFGLAPQKINFKSLRETTESIQSSCIFVRDSGKENALV